MVLISYHQSNITMNIHTLRNLIPSLDELSIKDIDALHEALVEYVASKEATIKRIRLVQHDGRRDLHPVTK